MNTRTAWNCTFCHATNVTTNCGCAASKCGEKSPTVVNLDDIHLDLPVRKTRRKAAQ